ncbi:MAG: NAD(P)-dependent alcohol dehydrogenase [Actinomycetota bacterium]|nr:NAD(P)-dependent alcohol dehydrogenase [Actinomycetota bacterium]
MQAVVQQGYGSADVLSIDTIDRPVAAKGEVVVQVHAAGMDRGTWHMMTGVPYAMRLVGGLRTPRRRVPGLDVAGVVVEVGSGVTRFRLGDEVFGIAKGSFAEFAAARESKLAPKPAGLSFQQAAALPVSGLTALQGLVDVGRLAAGQHVLIIGASGGVGTFAVQIAKALGAHVTAVCSTGKVDLVRSLGADEVIDYATTDFADGRRHDLILDIGGSSAISHLRRALAPRGTLVIVGGEGGGSLVGIGRQLRARALSPFTRQRLAMVVSTVRHTDLVRLSKFVDKGQLVPSIERTYPLADTAAAMRHLAAGLARGKLVVTP